jgi:CRP-like cAMP-binding protein
MRSQDEPLRGFWGDLRPDDRVRLRDAGLVRNFAAGHILVAQHNASDHVMVLWAGFVKVYRTDQGKDVVLGFRGPGDIVGEMMHLGSAGHRSASVVAIGDVKALVVAGDRFLLLIDRLPRLATMLGKVLVDRLREADSDRVASGSMNVGQRLARLLLTLADRYGTPINNGSKKIDLALSQKDLAACIGGSPRSVSRELVNWRRRAIIENGRQWVVVHNAAELRRIAGPTGQTAAGAAR